MRKLPLIAIFILSIFIGWQLFKPGFFWMHDDLQVMRLFEMRTCLNNGQIPCRWAPDMEFGYGQPMFNYYSAFPYYLGTFFNLLGFQFIDAVKLLFWLSLMLSGIFTYLLANRYLSKTSSFIAAAAYMLAPYHGVDIFVRGALAEAWGITLLPLVLYAVSLLSEKPSVKKTAILSLSMAAFLTTHNITSLISLPFIAIFALLQIIVSQGKTKTLWYLAAGTVLGVGLSSFFLIPAFFEKSLIQSENLINDYYNIYVHFPTVKQLLFSLHWGYGPSIPGPDDDLSFFIGVVQVISLLASPFVLFTAFKKANKSKLIFISFFFVLGLVSLLMTHGKSWQIWKAIPILVYVQFPWRFLSLVMLGTAILTGSMLESVKSALKPYIAALIIAVLLIFNVGNFHFRDYYPTVTDQDKLSGENFIKQSSAAIADYLPKTTKAIPTAPAPKMPSVTGGKVDINYFDKRSNYFASEFDVYSDNGQVEFPVMYFPDWTLYLDGGAPKMPINYNNDLGLITINLSKGHHLVQAWFESTPIRIASNLATFLSAAILISWLVISNEKYSKK